MRAVRSRAGRGRVRVLLAGVALAVLATGCEPGLTWGFAGNGASGTSGDAGPATAATLTAPGPMVAIPGGGFYVADLTDCVIRKVDGSGTISTVAGTAGVCGNSGDGGAATAAQIRPTNHYGVALALDAAGDLYFGQITGTDPVELAVRRVSTTGTISSVVASGAYGFTVAPDGTVYYVGTALSEVVEVTPGGSSSVVYSSATAHVLMGGLIYVGPGDLLLKGVISELWQPFFYRLELGTSTLTKLAPGWGDGLGFISSVTVVRDPAGPVYGTTTDGQVVQVNADGSTSVIAGNGVADPGSGVQFGQGTDLALSPSGLAVTPNNGLLISSGHVVYRLNDPVHAGS